MAYGADALFVAFVCTTPYQGLGRAGVSAEPHGCEGPSHGFGVGAAVAEGWIGQALAFWLRHRFDRLDLASAGMEGQGRGIRARAGGVEGSHSAAMGRGAIPAARPFPVPGGVCGGAWRPVQRLAASARSLYGV